MIKPKIGIIGGTALLGARLFKNPRTAKVKTPYGKAVVYRKKDLFLILRHGEKRNIPPHMINNKANLFALKKLGVRKVIGVCSSGSLKKSIKPGCFVVPDDYMNFSRVPTYFDKKIVHTTPGLDEGIRKALVKACGKAKTIKKGVYFQTHGPRLETKAEVKYLSKFADLAGMTMASEATCAKELGIGYACLCTVDNFANGIVRKPLSFEKIKEHAQKNIEATKGIINEALRILQK